MKNTTILQDNILNSLEHEEGKIAFLKAQELSKNDRHSYFAESIAREVDYICQFLKPLIGVAAKPHDINNDVCDSLLEFVIKRHWHLRTAS